MIGQKREQKKKREFLKNHAESVSRLIELLQDATAPLNNLPNRAITFSGGLDSSLIARLIPSTPIYTVGMQGSKDIDHAMNAAITMHWPLKLKMLSLTEIEQMFETVIPLLHKHNIECSSPNVALATLLYATLREMAKEKVKHVITGYGADSLFAGFDWHTKYTSTPEAVHENLVKSLAHGQEEVKRDALIAAKFGMTLHHPFLDPPLVSYAMRIHPSLKVNASGKKIILREVAIQLGLPEAIALREKSAGQYGSKIDHALLVLAKRMGSKKRKDYIASIIARETDELFV